MMKTRTILLLAGTFLGGLAGALPARGASVTLAPSADNTLFETNNGNISNGVGSFVFVGRIRTGGLRRAAIQFDIAGNLPAGAVIDRVSLRMFMNMTTSGQDTINLRRLEGPWGEGTSNASGVEGRGANSTPGDATWIHSSFPNQSWNTPGGDIAAAVSASTQVTGGGEYFWTSPTMVSDVQNWLDNPSSNNGWALVASEGPGRSAKRFGAREHPTANLRPSLTIDYYVQDGLAGVVNSGAGAVTDVVMINGSPGDANRVVNVAVGASITLAFNAPPMGPTGLYGLWVWAGIPCTPTPLNLGPSSLGVAVNPIPPLGGSPQPIFCLRSSGLPPRLCQNVNEVRNAPPSVPWSITDPNGSPSAGTFTIQGIAQDGGANNPQGFSATNAIILKIQ